MAVTIYDIADQAGTSYSTVSRALRDDKRISVATRENVKRVARKLGYRPNGLARSLKAGKTFSLGLIVGDIHTPCFAEMASMALQEAESRGYHLLIAVTQWDLEKELQCIDMMLQRRVDGLVVWSGALRPGVAQYDEVVQRKLPVVTGGRILFDDPREDVLPSVEFDWRDGMDQAVAHLKSKGHDRVGFVSQIVMPGQTAPKPEAFVQACEKHRVQPVHYACSLAPADQRAIGSHIAHDANRPGAIIVFSDYASIGVMRGLRNGGLHVPEDIAVIGMDNTDMGRDAYLALTSIDSSRHQLVNESIDILLEMQDSKNFVPRHVKVPTTLVVRESA